MNVLVTGAGRRGSLVRAFREAANPSGGRVVAADLSPLAPALYLADEGLPLPPARSDEYVDAVLEIVASRGIGLVVPTLDTELAPLAAARERFAARGCLALVSSPGFVAATGDKWATYEFCGANGVETHRSWLPGADPAELPERLFVKPRAGSASVGARPATRDTLETALASAHEPIVQERAEGDEVTVDALLGLDGETLHFVPRRRIRHLAGESIIGVTLRDDALAAWLARALAVCGAHGARGPLTLQCFLTPRGPLLTEVNPRFGGGFPLTHEAGGRYPEWCLRLAAGEHLAPCLGEYRAGLYMTRYYAEVFFEEPLWNP